MLNKPVLIPQKDEVTSLGSAIFAFVARGGCLPRRWRRPRTNSALITERSNRIPPLSLSMTGCTHCSGLSYFGFGLSRGSDNHTRWRTCCRCCGKLQMRIRVLRLGLSESLCPDCHSH